ncbi:MAG: hypothetical protein II894_03600, partial [Bacteroidales bacterium]|nr:hypothetical protein [Bacteroidales bacterium]
LPATLTWHGNLPEKGSKMYILDGSKMIPLKYVVKVNDGQVTVALPKKIAGSAQTIAIRFTM